MATLPINSVDMKTALSILLAFALGPFSRAEETAPPPSMRLFKGYHASLLPWERLTPQEFVDFGLWKKELPIREGNPDWRRHLGEIRLREKVGVVLECVGECQLFRDKGFSRAGFRSFIVEGDELSTGTDSYLWAYLMDGTLLRLSPGSLVSFREINIGTEENFLYVRIDGGNLLWLARHSQTFRQKQNQETDTLFLPLSYSSANVKYPMPPLSEDNLYAQIERKPTVFFRYQYLNQIIEENNRELFKKPTYSYLVFHNGTVAGRNLSLETIVQVGGESYFKLRDARQLGLTSAPQKLSEKVEAQFYFRGLAERSPSPLEVGRWYQVNPKGLDLRFYEGGKRFGVGEFVTSNIPTLLIAREYMARRHSLFAHASLDAKTLAANFGYRLWGSARPGSGGDLERRLNYLREHTRLTETMTITARENLRGRLEALGEKFVQYAYGRHYYSRAMQNYLNYRD